MEPAARCRVTRARARAWLPPPGGRPRVCGLWVCGGWARYSALWLVLQALWMCKSAPPPGGASGTMLHESPQSLHRTIGRAGSANGHAAAEHFGGAPCACPVPTAFIAAPRRCLAVRVPCCRASCKTMRCECVGLRLPPTNLVTSHVFADCTRMRCMADRMAALRPVPRRRVRRATNQI